MITFLIVIIGLTLVFDFINGFHDAANSIATVVSTKVLTPFQAVLWAAFFNFVALYIFTDFNVATTISKTVHEESITLPVIFAGIIAAIIWNLFTWWFGIPSSSSHTLMGGFAGAAIAHAGFGSINSDPILKTAMFIFLAPLIGGLLAFILSLWFLYSFRKDILPKILSVLVLLGIGWFLYTNLITDPAELLGERKEARFDSHALNVIFFAKNFKWILLCFIVASIAGLTFYLSSLNARKSNIWFKRFQLLSSAAFSIGHGGNDAQKAMGIIAASMIAAGQIERVDQMPTWVPFACHLAMALGTLSGGWRIVKTMGTRITKVTPFEGVAAETAGAITLFVTEALKVPVSTTHTITGAIMGVGATKRLSAVRWGVTINLLWAWILTIPVSALLAMGIYLVVRLFV
ncbi:MAG: anion permease [Flavisolibacter sp.]